MNDAEPSLVTKIVELHRALEGAHVRHAFGGALALAYHTDEPRTTADIDVNIAVDPTDASALFEILPDGIAHSGNDVRRVHADDQVRLWWGRTPVDLFFRAAAFHDGVADRTELHPFGALELPFLSAGDLAVFKALFDRPKDWVDIEAMHRAGSIVIGEVVTTLRELIGDDARVDRLLEIYRSTS